MFDKIKVQNVVNGKNGVFAPDETVTRAQAVTFLWRMAGRPEPAQTEIFADVENDANNGWYKTAIQGRRNKVSPRVTATAISNPPRFATAA